MVCIKCKLEKNNDNFSWKNKEQNKRNTICKKCQSLYAKEHYINNKTIYKERATKARPALRDKGKLYIIDYLKSHTCIDCGISDIRVLQFDHRISIGSKARRVGQLVNSINLLIEEIAKCDVRCANCHMVRTAQQFDWERIL